MDWIIVAIAVLFTLLLCVFGMAIGLFFQRKPIQHCGGATVEFKGERIDCPLCQGDEDACETES